MEFESIICFITLSFSANCLAQFPQSFVIQSKLDGKVLAVGEKYAPPAGGPYQRRGVAPVDESSSNVESWTFQILENPLEGNFYPNDSNVFWNSLTTGLHCADCFAYTHTYSVAQVTEEGARLLRIVDGLSEPITCVKNEGMGKMISRVVCDIRDVGQHWFFI